MRSSQINVVTRSGTNEFHGGAYEFFRNDFFNANNYFNKLTALVARPQLRYNDFGVTFGGPVVIPHLYNGRDKTFFFYLAGDSAGRELRDRPTLMCRLWPSATETSRTHI